MPGNLQRENQTSGIFLNVEKSSWKVRRQRIDEEELRVSKEYSVCEVWIKVQDKGCCKRISNQLGMNVVTHSILKIYGRASQKKTNFSLRLGSRYISLCNCESFASFLHIVVVSGPKKQIYQHQG